MTAVGYGGGTATAMGQAVRVPETRSLTDLMETILSRQEESRSLLEQLTSRLKPALPGMTDGSDNIKEQPPPSLDSPLVLRAEECIKRQDILNRELAELTNMVQL